MLNGIIELGGPEQFRLDELAEIVLKAKKDLRRVTADPHARYFGVELDRYSWLSQSPAG